MVNHNGKWAFVFRVVFVRIIIIIIIIIISTDRTPTGTILFVYVAAADL